jgi:hypothetical protein
MSNQPLAERIRPKTLDDYIGQVQSIFLHSCAGYRIDSAEWLPLDIWIDMDFAAKENNGDRVVGGIKAHILKNNYFQQFCDFLSKFEN